MQLFASKNSLKDLLESIYTCLVSQDLRDQIHFEVISTPTCRNYMNQPGETWDGHEYFHKFIEDTSWGEITKQKLVVGFGLFEKYMGQNSIISTSKEETN